MKKFVYLLFFLVSVFSVSAVVCEDNIQPLLSCQVVTPTLSCVTYNYSIYVNNITLLESGNLTPYAENTYYFNFSKEKNDYLIILCDGTTKVLYVNYYNLSVFGESFNWLAIVSIFLTISLLCLWISKKITKAELYLFKMLLFFYGLINSFIIISLTLFISSGATLSSFNNYFNVYVIIAIALLGLFVVYYAVYMFVEVIKEGIKGNK